MNADGADPFVADLSDRTPLQYAVLAGATKITNRIERMALWSGEVEVRVRDTMHGQMTKR